MQSDARGTRQPVLRRAELEGGLVRLRPVVPEDAAGAFALLHGRREVLDWLVWQGPSAPEEIAEFYASWRRDSAGGEDYHLAVVERASGRFAGCVGLRFAGHPYSGDIGYWIAPELWGRGYGSEAVRLATWLGFEPLRAVLLYASVFVGNHASRRALEKCGYAQDWTSSPGPGAGRRASWHLSLTRSGFLGSFAGWRPAALRIEVAQPGEGGAPGAEV